MKITQEKRALDEQIASAGCSGSTSAGCGSSTSEAARAGKAAAAAAECEDGRGGGARGGARGGKGGGRGAAAATRLRAQGLTHHPPARPQLLYWKDEAEASSAQNKSLVAGTASQRQLGNLKKRLAEAEAARDSAAANGRQAVQARTPPPRRRAAARRTATRHAAAHRTATRRAAALTTAPPRAAPPLTAPLPLTAHRTAAREDELLVVHRAHGATATREPTPSPTRSRGRRARYTRSVP